MGEHKVNNTPLGVVDYMAGIVSFLVVAYTMKALVTTVVPGLLKEETFVQILMSGFLFIAIWALVLNRLFQSFFSAYEQREAQTIGAKEEARKIRAEAEKIEQDLEQELQRTRFKALQENESLIEESKKEADKIVDAASTKATQQYDHNLSNIEAMKKKADGELEKEVAKLSEFFKQSALKPTGKTLH